MGVDAEALRPHLMTAAAKLDTELFTSFEEGLFGKLVPNVRKLGLLDANEGYRRGSWGRAGLMQSEYADDTGSDYDTYDEVAKDRASAG